ncbi:transcription elongation factor S-II protein [Theileria parva strain Muguga]|uniref:Transcription elongation factor SII, putative n=1 Tax=Theileria parva TaxID=5875 RepID=Q4N8B9_THEPA|nr:transcription elongation factor S-II protein [Theileria parva strain Muguga]EAN33789.1 transcription elongation factor S-II protein [Theileria parva strain Muguga]|eukprot:XP_766072.1 transcription elongation factor SII [Theileria parva strain Muguga]
MNNILELKRRIDQIINSLSNGSYNQATEGILCELESLSIDRDVLQSTRIGSSLTKLSKLLAPHSKEHSQRLITLINNWKNQLRSPKRIKHNSHSNFNNSNNSTDSVNNVDPGDTVTTQETNTNTTNTVDSVNNVENVDGDELVPEYAGPLRNDLHRDKALRYLFRCFLLGQDFGPELTRLSELINSMELSLYDHYVVENDNRKAYNQQLKCIAFNLKDVKNTILNYKLYNKMITVDELTRMTSLQMASDEKKLQRNEILEQSLEACQSDWAIKNIFLAKKSAGQFKCNKCNSKVTTYYQLQTRSSDEPMTTFVTCLNCKNRWRF